jgi:hypothetical protein
VNIGGAIIIDATGGVGTYTIAADCTGTISITDGPSFNMYVGPGAQQIWTTQIAGNAGSGSGLGVGTATRVPQQKLLGCYDDVERLNEYGFGAFHPRQNPILLNNERWNALRIPRHREQATQSGVMTTK